MPGAVRHEQKPGRAHAVGGEDDDVGGLANAGAGGAIDIDGAGGPAVTSGLDAFDARAGAQVDAGRQRARP